MTTLFSEATRLFGSLKHVGWNRVMCEMIAPLTTKINALKREKRALILAHSYQAPEILSGIADHVGDSYGLARKGHESDADIIVFCGVRFMAETAKILNPEKTVLLPAPKAGCSLAESITAADVRKLRTQYPDAAFVCYVNTSAEVKAECDVCCTSANALTIVNAVPQQRVVFLPDEYMAKNLAKETGKDIIGWNGRCIVHETFTPEKVLAYQQTHPHLKVLAHTECDPSVVALADVAGGTGDMVRYVKESGAEEFMLITECGLSDRMRMTFPEKRFLGLCGLCPYMKMTTLELVLQALEAPRPEQIIEIPEDTRVRAYRSLERMFELTEQVNPVPQAIPVEI